MQAFQSNPTQALLEEDDPWPEQDSEEDAVAQPVRQNRAGYAVEQAGMEEVPLIILKFSRSCRSFAEALLRGPELQECRDALRAAGFACQLESGAKVFVRPEHYQTICQQLRALGTELYASHVVVAAEFEGSVAQALAAVPSSDRVRQRQRDQLSVTWDRLQTDLRVVIDRTFLHIRLPSSLAPSVASSASRAARTV